MLFDFNSILSEMYSQYVANQNIGTENTEKEASVESEKNKSKKRTQTNLSTNISAKDKKVGMATNNIEKKTLLGG